MSQIGAIFRSFELISLPYLTKMIGEWGHFGAFAADSYFTRQALSQWLCLQKTSRIMQISCSVLASPTL